MKTHSIAILLILFFAAPAFATVAVSSPWNGATVGSTVPYAATATTSTCSKGVASMGIYVDYKLLYVVNGTKLNTSLTLSTGKHNTVVEEWDYCGGATLASMDITVSSQSGVYVASPANNGIVSAPANYVATATSTCAKGVASMGVYANNQLMVVQNGASLNTQLNLGAGNQHTVVEEWDYCGGATYKPVDVTVQGGTTLYNIQASGGWNSWAEFAPNYDICTSNCQGIAWSLWQHQTSPSLSGNASRFNIGGTTPYADVLWSNPVIGEFTTQGIPDTNHTLLPSLHYFTYDAYFFVTNAAVTQVLEFDISMYMNGVGMIWGNQCNNLGGKVWDIWDNVNAKWVTAGVPCNLINNAWNHVTIQAQRQSNNTLLFQSITLNGVTANINRTYAPFSVPTSWWGITLNYQMDGDSKMSSNTTYLDNLKFTYW
jgi:hypothetical protein